MNARPVYQLNKQLLNLILQSKTESSLHITGNLDVGDEDPYLFCQSIEKVFELNSNIESITLEEVSNEVVKAICYGLRNIPSPPKIILSNAINFNPEDVEIINKLNLKRSGYIAVDVEEQNNKRKVLDEFELKNIRGGKKLCLTNGSVEKPACLSEVDAVVGNIQIDFFKIKEVIASGYDEFRHEFHFDTDVAERFNYFPDDDMRSIFKAYAHMVDHLVWSAFFEFMANHRDIRKIIFSGCCALIKRASYHIFEELSNDHPDLELDFSRSNSNGYGCNIEEILGALIAFPRLNLNDLHGLGSYGALVLSCDGESRSNKITSLSLEGCGVRLKDLIGISKIPHLEELRLSMNPYVEYLINRGRVETKWNKEMFEVLGKMEKLKILYLTSCHHAKLNDIAKIIGNKNLCQLYLQENNVSAIDSLNSLVVAIQARGDAPLEIYFGYRHDGCYYDGSHDGLVGIMKSNCAVILHGLKEEHDGSVDLNIQLINLMSERNILIKKYPEYAGCFKHVSFQNGLYDPQFNEIMSTSIVMKNFSIFSEIKKRERYGYAKNIAELELYAYAKKLQGFLEVLNKQEARLIL